MDELFEATFSALAATGRPLSKCGKCKRYMKYIALKPNRLHCATCDETYSLPLNGNIKLYRELRCVSDHGKREWMIKSSNKVLFSHWMILSLCFIRLDPKVPAIPFVPIATIIRLLRILKKVKSPEPVY